MVRDPRGSTRTTTLTTSGSTTTRIRCGSACETRPVGRPAATRPAPATAVEGLHSAAHGGNRQAQRAPIGGDSTGWRSLHSARESPLGAVKADAVD
jgi:hypothetical protein